MSLANARRARFGSASFAGVCTVLGGSVLLASVAAGCGGDNSDPAPTTTSNTTSPGVGNTSTVSSTAEASSTASSTSASTSTASSGAGGSTSASTTDSTTATATTGTQVGNCSMTVPPNATISDFSDWSGTSWGAEGNLTGGTFGPYMGANTSDFNFVVNPTDAVLEVTGTVNDYAGFGMWFGPCTDASSFTGVQFDVSGSVGDAGAMVVQFQSSENAPIDTTNMRGDCEAASCKYAQATVESVGATVTTVMLPFSAFAGGAPVDTLSANQLLAIQFQFECETDMACAVDVVIDNLMFY